MMPSKSQFKTIAYTLVVLAAVNNVPALQPVRNLITNRS